MTTTLIAILVYIASYYSLRAIFKKLSRKNNIEWDWEAALSCMFLSLFPIAAHVIALVFLMIESYPKPPKWL